ncbi:undecaprenyl-diphosphatase [Hymenobacter daecheongensis DSM 21074]|uniref:Undecaprenyl-diphosphatase n=1 Tax=Hymenobacter daecheongensis DSM 21074 TaxID=1121955 RepID=A0A1M6LSI7_9BACT|nr:phosphatase PAP2 family protein [Hymenobacter daecheongensis]SHJ74177.1 undecaprenyl-diphosphatase [Hymenobacter daecheongensis DSM 21074]
MTSHLRRLTAGFLLFAAEFAVTLAVGLLGVAGFLALGRAVLAQSAAAFDARAFHWARHLLGENTGGWVQGVTFLASRNWIAGLALLLIGYFLVLRRHRWYSLLVPVVALGSITLNLLLKSTYQRARPLLPLVSASGLSFPSGHAMISASFYGLLIYLAQTHIRRHPVLRRGLTALLVVLILLIGLTRVYLRVHYASDVLAGFAAGLVWLVVAIPLLQKIEQAVKRRSRIGAQLPEKQPE